MLIKNTLLAASLITLSACSVGGGGGASKGPPATASECRAIVQKGMDLQGIPAGSMNEIVEQSAQKCVSSGKVTKADYQCVMAAQSASESRACKLNF